MNSIRLCRIVTGETIVGKQVDKEIKNCLLIQAMPMPDGQQIRMGISPYLIPYSRSEANIKLEHCVVNVDADPELARQYQQITSGIVSATPGDLKNLIQMPTRK